MPNLRRGMMGAAGVSAVTEFSIWSWGRNDNGQLGDGTTTVRSSPVQMGDLSTWTKMDYLSGNNSGAINSAGELWTWGDNGNGKLGLGDTTNRSSPTQVGSLTDWAASSDGGDDMVAVKTDGTLWSWGRNNDGQGGVGNTTAYSSPNQVGSLTDWSSATKRIIGGNTVTRAIKTDGTLWSWGNYSSGQLGLGAGSGSKCSPNQVGSLTDWASLASAQNSTAAIKTDGTLWTWGAAGSGQLANGTETPDISSPVQVGSLTDWSEISGAGSQYLSLKTDGTLWVWGSGASGRLGLGSTTSYSSPVQVGSLTDWYKVNSIQEGANCTKTDGTLWTWGNASQGGTGQGTTTNTSSPVQVGSDTDWLNVSNSWQLGAASRSA